MEASAYFCAAAVLREWDGAGAAQPMRVVVGVTSKLVQMTFHDRAPEGAGGGRRAGPGAERGGGKEPARGREKQSAGPGPPVSAVALEAVQDRVAALDGSLRSGHDTSGRWLVIEIPLAPADLAAPHAAREAHR